MTLESPPRRRSSPRAAGAGGRAYTRTVIGPYRIVEQVGRGGMATVYKAHQAALARYVAVKVLPDFLASEEGFKERFQQEAVSVAKLRHPNILAVFDYGNAEGTAYIVNEFVDGGTLSDQLGSPLPMDYVVNTLKPIAAALDYAHARAASSIATSSPRTS